MAALDVPREDDPRILAEDFSLVDMPKCPVIVASRSEAFERARCIVLEAFAASAIGVQESDVKAASNALWITHREILGDSLSRKTLAVNNHIQRLDTLGGCLPGLEHVDIVRIRQ